MGEFDWSWESGVGAANPSYFDLCSCVAFQKKPRHHLLTSTNHVFWCHLHCVGLVLSVVVCYFYFSRFLSIACLHGPLWKCQGVGLGGHQLLGNILHASSSRVFHQPLELVYYAVGYGFRVVFFCFNIGFFHLLACLCLWQRLYSYSWNIHLITSSCHFSSFLWHRHLCSLQGFQTRLLYRFFVAQLFSRWERK